MQRMQRKVGAFMPRTAGDAQVNILIHEFEEADRMLTTLIDASKAWRDAWSDILMRQSAILAELEAIYKPIAAPDCSGQTHIPAETLEEQMGRTSTLKETYAELRQEMVEELQMVETRIVNPARETKESIKFMKKVIKNRDNKKLDYERYNSRCESLRSKTKRSDRENVSLQKNEVDLERASADYEVADDRLKSSLPGVVHGAFSMLPHLLNAQILVQNALLGHLYTSLHNFCQDYGFESPPPEVEVILRAFHSAFTPICREIESNLMMIAHGKSVQTGKSRSHENERGKGGFNIRNGFSRKPSDQPAQPSPPLSKVSSYGSQSAPSEPGPKPKIPSLSRQASSNLLSPTTSHQSHASTGTSPSTPSTLEQLGSYGNYYGRVPSAAPINRIPSASSVGYFPPTTPGATTSAAAAIAAAKKKPPPPPPKKKPNLQQPADYVVALYDFDGDGNEDLSFREGDRIRVLKRTKSNIDWWEGELGGVRGSFPANYCK
ncbi:SH3 domain signaling protein [Eremomyces bilateralis CBS 781.70]|uniref:SH3 domain signaling protein n=1 Tax=Eremomyces bilateralis CBS 781.70 TaxID=1392243 RepID=A0A6G1G3J4_9PEZI|nr:SH3 domain signaling protein [Eremomyces bilateralis CBS 781.70]KAF1812486.1 SH3 domain signaling protein [Eremomyces bilateralis CBS 781.70]